MKSEDLIRHIIQPENGIELAIINDPEFITGALYGKPRSGHPEGQVIYHIKEVLANVDKYSTEENRKKLRLIAIIHDTFKHQVNDSFPKHGDNHHGYYAKLFASKYIKDNEALNIIQLHDEAYACWIKGFRGKKWGAGEERLKKLVKELGNSLELYSTFYRCDNETGNKTEDCYNWFLEKTKK